MKLKILGSSSAGNGYVFTDNNGQNLVVDMGVRFDVFKKAMEFDMSGVVGLFLTHSHMDHCKGALDAAKAGIDVYCSAETREEAGLSGQHRVKEITVRSLVNVGPFSVMPFEVKHDVKCFGYLINHVESGTICFITDTFYVPYRFKNLSHVIVEANYCEKIVDAKLKLDKRFLRDRILQSHMELQTTKQFLLANDLSDVMNVVLIHLSDSNSHAENFRDEIAMSTQKNVIVADAGMEILLNKEPF